MPELRQHIHDALWHEHFADDSISGVTEAECWLLTDQVMEKLQNVGLLRSPRAR